MLPHTDLHAGVLDGLGILSEENPKSVFTVVIIGIHPFRVTFHLRSGALKGLPRFNLHCKSSVVVTGFIKDASDFPSTELNHRLLKHFSDETKSSHRAVSAGHRKALRRRTSENLHQWNTAQKIGVYDGNPEFSALDF